MASNGLSTYAEWMWKSNLNPFSTSEVAEWCSYSEEDGEIIENAYRNRDRFAYLTNYTIDLKQREQILNKNDAKRRPVKRVVHNKGKKTLKRRLTFDQVITRSVISERSLLFI